MACRVIVLAFIEWRIDDRIIVVILIKLKTRAKEYEEAHRGVQGQILGFFYIKLCEVA